VKPGEVFEVSITLNVIGHTFKQGWRIRLALSTSLFPTLWQTPEIAIATVYTGPMENVSPSTLSLPLRRPRADDSRMPQLFPPDPTITCVNSNDYIIVDDVGRPAVTNYTVEPITEGSKNGFNIKYTADSGEKSYGGPLQDLYVNETAVQNIQIYQDDPLSLVAFSNSTLVLARTTGNGVWEVKSQISTTVWTQKCAGGLYSFRYKAEIETFIGDGAGGYIPFEKRTDQGVIPPPVFNIAPIMELLLG
jgi:hypothetical protein